MNRPLWRWWLFRAALHVHFNCGGAIGRRALAVMGWCVLPEWLGWDGSEVVASETEVPF